jgi:hypothetical protein
MLNIIDKNYYQFKICFNVHFFFANAIRVNIYRIITIDRLIINYLKISIQN